MKDKAHILVIDDEESIRFTFDRFLSDEGHQVATAHDYDDAISKISGNSFDLIFADIVLGGKTGLEVVREVKRRNLSCPVVMITGDPNVDSASAAVRLGALDYLSKPVKQDSLLRITEMALRHKRLNDEKEKYRLNIEAIFRSVKDAIITVDLDLKIVELNEAALSLCGLSRDAIGKAFDSVDTGCCKKCLGVFRETISMKHSVEIPRLECRRAVDHSLRVVAISSSPLLDHQGLFSGAVVVIRDETRLAGLEKDLKDRRKFHSIVGGSAKMQEIYSLIESLAEVPTTVLISGESGTGKELVADALHYSSDRSERPLVKVNCSALSEGLLESELFGHVRGAFTGAVKDKVGRFQMADGGTIFLDEIGEVSPQVQLRLLRVLQERIFERVGDSSPMGVDVRVIAATNRDLAEKVRRGEFREDLYYRLKVVEIQLPPLRDHIADLTLLIEHFLDKFNKKYGKHITGVTSDVQEVLAEYPWPGNIRELEHSIEHAFVHCREGTITIDHLPRNFRNLNKAGLLINEGEGEEERSKILKILEKTAWNKAKAARTLNIDRSTLYRKMEKYNIIRIREDFH
jgi:PAS domain S-box-containing protein